MRISFDIDDTLIFYEKSKNGKDKLLNGEYLREGTLELLKELQEKHELWIYTTSFRNPYLLKFSFFLKGIKITRVINQNEHMKLTKILNPDSLPTKLPSHFGIDLHIDDSKGVLIEGQKHGFNVLRIDPDDQKWLASIRNRIDTLES